MAFANLPGVLVNTVDGGLVARRIPRAKSTLVIGTAAQGLADEPYQVTDRAQAALDFGFSGNIIRAMEEVATYSDNILLFRMGTKPLQLQNIGKEYAVATNITNVVRTSNVTTVTSAAHGLAVGDRVKVAAVTNTTINGEFVVTVVGSASLFSYANTGTNIVTGADTGTVAKVAAVGFNISFGDRTSTAASDYKIWYKAGVLAVWRLSSLVWSNDSGLGVTDNGDILISDRNIVASSLGLFQGTAGAVPTLANAVTITAAAALAGSATQPATTLVAATTGIGLTGRQNYVALAKALDLLTLFQVDQVFCPIALVDQPNIAHFVTSDVTALSNNPVSNADALDYIKVTTAADGSRTYQWANDVVDSEGNTVSAMGVVANATARIAAGFYEASFPYLMANFCQKQGETLGGCIAFMGTNGPQGFKLIQTRAWVGYLPTYDGNSIPTASGAGLLGIPVLVGCTTSKLHSLTSDFATGFRLRGMYQTVEGQYDGSPILDKNQNKVDIGAYVHVIADRAGMSNAFKANYEGGVVGMVAGFCSMLDEKSNLTNKPLNVIQLWKPSQSQLDALTFANISVLRFKDLNLSPTLLHGETIASPLSDYTNLLRVRIKFMVVGVLFDEADKFIGESTIDGLQLSAMKTALEARMVQLQKRGYVSFADFKISTTDADQRIGHARIDVSFTPANELVQLNAFVGVSRR
jgi:hypothetical protein